MANLYSPRDSYEVKSGEKCKLVATVVYEQNEKERKQLLIWDEEHGYVDQKGLFTAPTVEQDITFTVNVRRQEEPDEVKTIMVLVKRAEEKKSERQITEWEVKSIGERGNYAIRVQLFDQYKKGIKGEIVFTDVSTPTTLPSILPNPSAPAINQPVAAAPNTPAPGTNPIIDRELKKSTDDDGYLKIVLNSFQEKERCIHVDCIATGLDKFLLLTGPKILIPKAKFNPKAGFWANLTQNFPQQPAQQQQVQQKHLLRRRN